MAIDLDAIRARQAAIERGCNCGGGFTAGCPCCDAQLSAPSDVAVLLGEVERITRRNTELTASEDRMAAELRCANAQVKMVCGENKRLLGEVERLRAQERYDSVYFRCASDGEVAQQSGVTRDANPYRADDSTRGTLMDEAWDDGWCAADYERLAAENKRLREAVEFAVWSGNLSQLRKALGREDA